MRPTVLLVTGSGRSGTSALAGVLHTLGWQVPGPMVKAAERNPKGHFESLWTIRFHRRHLARAHVDAHDTRPQAAALVADSLDKTSALDDLTAWLSPMRTPRILIKDPLSSLFVPLWQEATSRAGLDLRLLTIVRHPAEVVGSRDRAWGQGRDDERRELLETRNVMQWVNMLLTTEEHSRGLARSYLRYSDLLTDWRSTLSAVDRHLDLQPELDGARAREVDSWLDTDLQHVALTWPDLRTAPPVRDLAQTAWDATQSLLVDPHDPAALSTLAGTRRGYDELYRLARAVVDDELTMEVGRRQEQVKRLKARLQKADQAVPSADRGLRLLGRRRRPR